MNLPTHWTSLDVQQRLVLISTSVALGTSDDKEAELVPVEDVMTLSGLKRGEFWKSVACLASKGLLLLQDSGGGADDDAGMVVGLDGEAEEMELSKLRTKGGTESPKPPPELTEDDIPF